MSLGDMFGGGKDDPFAALADMFKPKSEPAKPARPKLQLRRKVVDGVAYIHADDVAALLDAANVQPALAQKLRDLNK